MIMFLGGLIFLLFQLIIFLACVQLLLNIRFCSILGVFFASQPQLGDLPKYIHFLIFLPAEQLFHLFLSVCDDAGGIAQLDEIFGSQHINHTKIHSIHTVQQALFANCTVHTVQLCINGNKKPPEKFIQFCVVSYLR